MCVSSRKLLCNVNPNPNHEQDQPAGFTFLVIDNRLIDLLIFCQIVMCYQSLIFITYTAIPSTVCLTPPKQHAAACIRLYLTLWQSVSELYPLILKDFIVSVAWLYTASSFYLKLEYGNWITFNILICMLFS